MPKTLGTYLFTLEECERIKDWYLKQDPDFTYGNSKELLETSVKMMGHTKNVGMQVLYSAYEKGKYSLHVEASGLTNNILAFDRLVMSVIKP